MIIWRLPITIYGSSPPSPPDPCIWSYLSVLKPSVDTSERVRRRSKSSERTNTPKVLPPNGTRYKCSIYISDLVNEIEVV